MPYLQVCSLLLKQSIRFPCGAEGLTQNLKTAVSFSVYQHFVLVRVPSPAPLSAVGRGCYGPLARTETENHLGGKLS